MMTSIGCRRRFTGALRDRTPIEIRPLADGEQQPVLDVFAGLSSSSRYLRYLAPLRELSPHLLNQLTRVDGHDRVALIALSGGHAVGEVRFVRLPDAPETADLAVSVIDEIQGRGLGRLLLHAAVASAAEGAVAQFSVTIHPENRPSLGLMRSFGARLRIEDGLYEGRLPVPNLLRPDLLRSRIPEQGTA